MNRLFSLILFGTVSFSSIGIYAQNKPVRFPPRCTSTPIYSAMIPISRSLDFEKEVSGTQSRAVLVDNTGIKIPPKLVIDQLLSRAIPKRHTFFLMRHAKDQDTDSVHIETNAESHIQYTLDEKGMYSQLMNETRSVLISSEHPRNIETCEKIFGKTPIIEENLHEISIEAPSEGTTKSQVAASREILELFADTHQRNPDISSETVSSASERASIGLSNIINTATLNAINENIPAPDNYIVASNSAIIACLIRVLRPASVTPVILKPLDGIIVQYDRTTGELRTPITKDGKLLIFSPSKRTRESDESAVYCPLKESIDYFNSTNEGIGLRDKITETWQEEASQVTRCAFGTRAN